MKEDNFIIENYGVLCDYCNKTFLPKSKASYFNIKSRRKNKSNLKFYCSEKCRLLARNAVKPLDTFCKNCGKRIIKVINKRNKSGNYFCCRSCAASYNNTHKTIGTRRSKLEKWLENKLTTLYPTLEIKYCDKSAINSELDIYIPSLRLAFELNGIYHYEPIHGLNKLNQVQRNDANKFQLCQENNISLCIIDTSKQKYITEKSSLPYLEIIIKIINSLLE